MDKKRCAEVLDFYEAVGELHRVAAGPPASITAVVQFVYKQFISDESSTQVNLPGHVLSEIQHKTTAGVPKN